MFVSDIGEVYAEQGESADTLYIAGLTYDTSIKVQTVNGEKTIPTLDGMDELETRVQNIEKKVSSADNEMSLIETDIAEVNENISSVEAQIAQWVLVGEIKAYLGATVPDKYLLCNGQEIAVADYPELYNVIGALECCQSGNEGMFKVPDLKGRFLEGANGNLGKRIEAGLPNITAIFGAGGREIGYGGAVSKPSYEQTCQNGSGNYFHFGTARFNASNGECKTDGTYKSESDYKVYGKSNTVQPPAISVNYIIRAKI